MNKSLLTLLIIIVAATFMYIITGYFKTGPIPCTQEARICPDGTAVKRSGPYCEFAACPTLPAPSAVPTISEAGSCCTALQIDQGFRCLQKCESQTIGNNKPTPEVYCANPQEVAKRSLSGCPL